MQACNLRIFKKLRDMITIIFTQNSLQFLLFFQFSPSFLLVSKDEDNEYYTH